MANSQEHNHDWTWETWWYDIGNCLHLEYALCRMLLKNYGKA